METNTANAARQPWNKGKLVGQKKVPIQAQGDMGDSHTTPNR
jgi:hypothetical protein